MGSPKTAKSAMKQGIWRRRGGAPFAAVLVAAVLAVVVFSGQFAKGPNASSQFAPVQADNTLRPACYKPLSTDQDLTNSSEPQGEDTEQKNENKQSPNNEAVIEEQKLSQAVAIEQDDNTSNPEFKQSSQDTVPVSTHGDERSAGGSDSLGKESRPQSQEGGGAADSGSAYPCKPVWDTALKHFPFVSLFLDFSTTCFITVHQVHSYIRHKDL